METPKGDRVNGLNFLVTISGTSDLPDDAESAWLSVGSYIIAVLFYRYAVLDPALIQLEQK